MLHPDVESVDRDLADRTVFPDEEIVMSWSNFVKTDIWHLIWVN